MKKLKLVSLLILFLSFAPVRCENKGQQEMCELNRLLFWEYCRVVGEEKPEFVSKDYLFTCKERSQIRSLFFCEVKRVVGILGAWGTLAYLVIQLYGWSKGSFCKRLGLTLFKIWGALIFFLMSRQDGTVNFVIGRYELLESLRSRHEV